MSASARLISGDGAVKLSPAQQLKVSGHPCGLKALRFSAGSSSTGPIFGLLCTRCKQFVVILISAMGPTDAVQSNEGSHG